MAASGGFVLFFSPGVTQGDDAVEHRPAGLRIDRIGTEVPLSLELDLTAGGKTCQKRFRHCGFQTDARPGVEVGFEAGILVCFRVFREKQPVIEADLTRYGVAGGNPVNGPLDLATVGSRPAPGCRIVGAVNLPDHSISVLDK